MKPWIRWTLATLVCAAAIHIVSVWAFPHVILRMVSKRILSRGVPVNVAYHAPPNTPDQRTVVMPSPDLLYSIVVYDMSRGPLRITVDIPDDYWSLSFYADNTDNFFVINDRQAKSKQFEIILLPPEGDYPSGRSVPAIRSPSTKGVILARHLITDPVKVGERIALQRRMQVEALRR